MAVRDIDSAEALAAYQLECQLVALKKHFSQEGNTEIKAYLMALCQQGITCLTMLGIPAAGKLTESVITLGGDVSLWLERIGQ